MIHLLFLLTVQASVIHVDSGSELRAAVISAKPGTQILIAPGDYPGGFFFERIHGSTAKPIVIRGADAANPPRFLKGSNGMQISEASYLEIRDIVIDGATGNGLNIDDGGTPQSPTHHIAIRNVKVMNIPEGNRDGIKLSGVDDFRVENVTIDRWGGSGIDMVGCHRGVIDHSQFLRGENGVQCKGGTSDILILRSRFVDFGGRGVNIGGSTGMQFFRPPVEKMSPKYEAKNIRVQGCTFIGGDAPVAFVGVDGADVSFNTIVNPRRWAMRILQETTATGFVPSRNGTFRNNLIVFRSDQWFEGGVNIGPGTEPGTFKFEKNFWFCSDRPERSTPRLPTAEKDGNYGRDPKIDSNGGIGKDSPAANVGAHALRQSSGSRNSGHP